MVWMVLVAISFFWARNFFFSTLSLSLCRCSATLLTRLAAPPRLPPLRLPRAAPPCRPTRRRHRVRTGWADWPRPHPPRPHPHRRIRCRTTCWRRPAGWILPLLTRMPGRGGEGKVRQPARAIQQRDSAANPRLLDSTSSRRGQERRSVPPRADRPVCCAPFCPCMRACVPRRAANPLSPAVVAQHRAGWTRLVSVRAFAAAHAALQAQLATACRALDSQPHLPDLSVEELRIDTPFQAIEKAIEKELVQGQGTARRGMRCAMGAPTRRLGLLPLHPAVALHWLPTLMLSVRCGRLCALSASDSCRPDAGAAGARAGCGRRGAQSRRPGAAGGSA